MPASSAYTSGWRIAEAIFSRQHGLATRSQLLAAGVSVAHLRTAVTQCRWVTRGSGLYEVVNWPNSAERSLHAACLRYNGVASHESAAWLWGLLKREPFVPVLSVPHDRRPEVGTGRATLGRGRRDRSLSDAIVRRSRDLAHSSITYRHGIPTTNPLRSLVDLAGYGEPALVDEAIDAGLAVRLVTVEGLRAEAARLARHGRRGPKQLTERLEKRGFAGAPAPSVLESRALRLLAANKVKVERCEVVVEGTGYRLDIQLEGSLFVELDGYAYHCSPEQKRYDDARRNKLRLMGFEILVYDWQTVTKQGAQMVKEIRGALAMRDFSISGARIGTPDASLLRGSAVAKAAGSQRL
jgi:very-short-patch-repair endonuclease